jgi:hypothetical protein
MLNCKYVLALFIFSLSRTLCSYSVAFACSTMLWEVMVMGLIVCPHFLSFLSSLKIFIGISNVVRIRNFCLLLDL